MKKIFLEILKKHKIMIFITIFFIALNVFVSTLPSKMIGKIVDLLYNIPANKTAIMNHSFYLIGVVILAMLVRLPWRWLVVCVNRGVEKDLKNKLFEHFTKIKMGNIQKIKNGEIMSYFAKDVSEIRVAVYRILSHGTRVILTLIIAGTTMATGVNLKLTMMTLLPILITSYLIVVIKKYVEKSFKKSQRYFTELSEFVQESTDSIRTTKAYSQEYYQLKDFIRKNRMLRASNNAVDIHSTLLSTCVNVCFGLCYAISLLYGSNLVLAGEITVGDFVAFNGYIALFVGPISWIPGVISRFKRAQISYRRLSKFFDLEKEKIDVKVKDLLEELDGNIQIKDLTFNYADAVDIVLEDINLELKKGETLGIIGTIGSGKTTLLNLLIGLYPVKRGKILIDGKDINDIPLPVLRENICYITQDNFLFSTTLKENINLFKDTYDSYFIKESTREAMIYKEIQDMPKQIETVLGGEQGVELSGGQRQRIAVSRAFLKRSNIVLLDDTFSALDNRTEKALLENVKELTGNKTCIIVSNKIADIKDADKIIVLDQGNIIEAGNHQTLLEKQGMYYSFYMQQSSRENEGC